MSKIDVFSKTIELDQSACYLIKEYLEVLSSSLSLRNVLKRIRFLLADNTIYYFGHTEIFELLG